LFNTSYNKNSYFGLQPGFFIDSTVPDAPSGEDFYGVPFSRYIGETIGVSGGFESDVSDNLYVRGTVGHFEGIRDVRYNGAEIINADGDYILQINPHNSWDFQEINQPPPRGPVAMLVHGASFC